MKFLSVVCIFALLSTCAKSQKVNLDLSIGKGTTFSQTIEPKTITEIVLVNRLVGKDHDYKYIIEKKPNPIGPLPSFQLLGGTIGPCDALLTALSNLNKENDERNVPEKIKELKAEVSKASQSTCSNEIATATKTILAATDQSIKLVDPQTIKKGEKLKITITRDNITWIYEFKTEQIDHWKVYFGFTYVADAFSKFNNYYAKADTGTTYLVSKMNNDNKHVLRNISPTVLFSYRFFHKEDAPIKFGLTGGFMYNLETLGAMAGPSVILGDNISLTVGVTTLQKHRLLGQYIEGQRLKETLTFDQLHEKVWTYDVFFSLGFNIPDLFKKSSEKSKKAADKEE